MLLQTTIPDYRVAAIAGLRERLGQRLVVVAGESDFSEGVRLAPRLSGVAVVENVFLLGRRLLWQRRCVRRLSRSSTLVLELNPRIVSSWLLLLRRRLARRRTVLYGHAWPRRGASASTDRVRGLMRRLGDAVIVYTESQARELGALMPGTVVRAAPNALYSRALAIGDAAHRRPARTILFVGRLVPAKKPLLLLEGFARVANDLPACTRLVFVGDGPLAPALWERARDLGVSDRVELAGHVEAFDRLRVLYADALVSVSPGYAGLSLTQSLWFGVPVLIARDEPHAPEIEAAEAGVNSVFFESDSSEALGRELVRAFEDRDRWLQRGPEIAAVCVSRYSLESMVDAIVEVVDGR